MMSVMFWDIHAKISRNLMAPQIQSYHCSFWEMVYADDTVIVGRRAREINLILAEIEKEGKRYNLQLNQDKCMYINMNHNPAIHFANGQAVPKASETTYLGSVLTRDASRNTELNARLSKALNTCGKLKTFWYKTNARTSWKLQIYNAIIIAQMTYGLSTLHMTNAMLKKVNAFHMRELRYILKIEHAYYSRISNEEVINRANLALNDALALNTSWQVFLGQTENPKKVKMVGEIIKERQMKLLGRVLRLLETDPMKEATCWRYMLELIHVKNRVGRPREKWFYANFDKACQKNLNVSLGKNEKPNGAEHLIGDELFKHKVNKVFEAAISRKF